MASFKFWGCLSLISRQRKQTISKKIKGPTEEEFWTTATDQPKFIQNKQQKNGSACKVYSKLPV